MKGMVWNCSFVEWYTQEIQQREENCVLVFVCFERDDSARLVPDIARRILQLNKNRFKRASIVIFSYAHLSSRLSDIHTAEYLCISLAERLKIYINPVHLFPFNCDKRIVIDLCPTNNDVSFFEY